MIKKISSGQRKYDDNDCVTLTSFKIDRQAGNHYDN